MIDENAFGILVAHYNLEGVEYSLEEAVFLEYLGRFEQVVEGRLRDVPLSNGLRRLDVGHGVYLEFADGEQLESPLTWARETRAALVAADLPNVCVLSFGGRWVTDADATSEAEPRADRFGPSEPLRKALAAEAHAQPTHIGDEEEHGWGPGLFVEQEAIERLGKAFKNAPTPLHVLSSVFYRIGA
ncbi:MAG: hypothetical protein QM784_16020 [Polyangiaceae bacterium]